jgi:hypothetical protein
VGDVAVGLGGYVVCDRGAVDRLGDSSRNLPKVLDIRK